MVIAVLTITSVTHSSSSPIVLSLDEIKRAIDLDTLLPQIAHAFRQYSEGEAVVPPVGHLAFDRPAAGDVHVKYGYIRGAEHYVVKIASGFPGNLGRGLPVTNGVMLLFRQATGELVTVLLDEGYLTDLRTAAAGAIAATHLGPSSVARIGIVGTGVQARLQLRLLPLVTPCRDVVVWGRSEERARAFRDEITREGFRIETTRQVRQLAASCNLIVTATLSREPLIDVADVRPGTHITAVGADAPGKQELDPRLVSTADIVVADSIAQCVDHGELAHAVHQGALDVRRVIELGRLIADPGLGRSGVDEITVADLTGAAVQDIQIATHVHERATMRQPPCGSGCP